MILPGLLLSILLLFSPATISEAAAQDSEPEEKKIELLNAESALAAALAEAEETGRHVFVHTGADW
jgi:hypothetical protein